MKPLFKTVFIIYLLVLSWLVFFKFSYDIVSVIMHHQTRSLDLIPFSGAEGGWKTMLANVIVFIPFGLLLSVNFKRISLWRKLIFVCLSVSPLKRFNMYLPLE